jgi:hypothetical protein
VRIVADGARIVLVKPGDVLAIGNFTGDCDALSEALNGLKEHLGLAHILVFEDDIDLAAISSTKTA